MEVKQEELDVTSASDARGNHKNNIPTITVEYVEYDEEMKIVDQWIQIDTEPACKLCRGKMWIRKMIFTDGEIAASSGSPASLRKRGRPRKNGFEAENILLNAFEYVECDCHPEKQQEPTVQAGQMKSITNDAEIQTKVGNAAVKNSYSNFRHIELLAKEQALQSDSNQMVTRSKRKL